tara:strand:- start:1017 stop:2453 length:1437 start_codon:yes stop_codon:yes gene_type:complete
MTYFSIKFEKDLLYSLKILSSDKKLKNILNESEYNFTNCFIKGLIGSLSASREFEIFISDLYSRKLKKKYFFNSLEEMEVAKILLKKYKLKTSLGFQNKIKYFIYLFIFKIILKLLICLNKILDKKSNIHLKNIYFYIINLRNIKVAEKIGATRKNTFNKFLIFKNILNLFSKKQNFFLKKYVNNKFLSIQRMWLNFYLIQSSVLILKPKMILSFEGDAWDHEMLYLLSKKIGFKSLCIQTATDLETFQKAGFHNLRHTKLLVWGKHYKNIYSKISSGQSIKIVGDILLDEKTKSKDKKYIGVLLQKKNNKISEKNLEKFKYLVKWLFKEFNGKIIIRPHPADKDDYYNLQSLISNNDAIIHNPNEVSIGTTLNECSMVFAKYSSTIVEAASVGVIPVILDTSLKFEAKIEDLRKYNPILISNSVEQIKKSITILQNNGKKREFIKKKIISNFKNHINYFGKDSLKLIKSEIMNEFKK